VRGVGTEGAETRILAQEATLPLQPAGRLRLVRDERVIDFLTPEPLPDNALAHPFLAPAAALAAAWEGDLTFHGGAFVVDGGAWCVLGLAAAGKSSLLAVLANQGTPVLSDDLVIARADGKVPAGPRCVDLRPDVAERLGVGTDIGVVGARERWRVELPAVDAETPLAGFVDLRWAGDAACEPVPEPERARLLEDALAVVPTERATAAIDAASRLPMIRLLRRPGSWDLEGDAARVQRASEAATRRRSADPNSRTANGRSSTM
jgi:hypothetical protein